MRVIPSAGMQYSRFFAPVQGRGGGFFRGLPIVRLLAACLLAACLPAGPHPARAGEPAPVHAARILAEFPHDPQAFTQGLFFLPGGDLIESTGLYGSSEIRRVRLRDGKVLRRERLPAHLFGEGAALAVDAVVQLTWREGRALARDPGSLAVRGEFRYVGEGWGLTFDGRRLIMSNGSARLIFRDPATFARLGDVVVTDGGLPVEDLNELEWVERDGAGLVLANVWRTPYVVGVEPESGRVRWRLDLSECWRRSGGQDERFVPNGIAWDAAGGRLLVTGKGWPRLYQVAWPETP